MKRRAQKTVLVIPLRPFEQAKEHDVVLNSTARRPKSTEQRLGFCSNHSRALFAFDIRCRVLTINSHLQERFTLKDSRSGLGLLQANSPQTLKLPRTFIHSGLDFWLGPDDVPASNGSIRNRPIQIHLE
jgi:hypothetical protein